MSRLIRPRQSAAPPGADDGPAPGGPGRAIRPRPPPSTAPELDPSGRWWAPWVLALVVALVGLWAPGPTTLTADEPIWLARSDRFVEAVRSGDLDSADARLYANVSTMPGVTTMLAGGLGRGLAHVGDAVGISAPVTGPSVESPQVLRAARGVVTVTCAALLGLLVVLAARLVGRRAALVGGALLGAEPFVAGHAGVLHTDAMVTMFGAVSIVAAMAALWAPTRPRRPPWPDPGLAAVSAVAGGLALLTKLNAVALVVPALVVVAVIDLVLLGRARRGSTPVTEAVGRPVVLAATWLVGAVGTVVVLWPALWTSPLTQLDNMRDSARLADQPYPTFFDGEVVVGPGWTFLPTVVLHRMTPWLLLGGAVAVVAAVVHLVRPWAPVRRRVVAALLVAPVPYLLVVGGATKVYDRYALPVWPFLALLAGVAVDGGLRRLPRDLREHRLVPALGAAALAVALLLDASASPYRTAYASPLGGGQQGALESIPVGWREGMAAVGQTVAEREGDRCDEVVVYARYDNRIAFPCGRLLSTEAQLAGQEPDYIVRDVSQLQRPIFDRTLGLIPARATLVDELRIGGVTYAELWEVDHDG
ncbi:glycosyltransferase family 39 protein [Iamia majanohamensis]|uniref:Glycosyltransferase family 39 protein n=1 Tax=Iamia majanohamensis TaxID=467976 RepID=A0AAF0BRD6_9ACTN|nr:glycosyltransferase family 39 protein [Iamia majanohamensis]WCO66471.1 glycosyltransferase family 39 protein [Iamia majanohamensis]